MGRSPCCDKEKVKRGPWSPEEDAVLKSYVETYGTGGNWIALPNKAGLKRCGKSCRLRWLNYLRPDIKHGGFTEQEDNIIFSLYETMGSRWSVIASQLPGRTDNDVKNHWNTKLRKKLMAPKTKDLHPHVSSKTTCASTQWTSPSSTPSTAPSLARASGVVTGPNSVKYVYNDTSKFDSVNHQHENSVISQGIEAGYSYYNMEYLSHKLELHSMPSAFAESPSQQSNEDSVNLQPLPYSSFDSSCISWIVNSGVGAEDSFSPVDPSAGFRCESQKTYLVQERGSQLMDDFSASAAYNSASFIFPYANLLLSPDVAPIL